MHLKKTLLFLTLSLLHSIYAQDVFIIIPGTWSTNAIWHQPGGDFFEMLKRSLNNLQSKIITFSWSGKNRHDERVKAAHKLADLIEQHDRVILIGHSHGSNVGALASQELAKRKSKSCIHIFYALGTPIDTLDYMPDMTIIGHLYNLFSFGDIVQPVLGAFSRVYPEHERIANITITINGQEPSHTQLHHTAVAQWLPQLHQLLTQTNNVILNSEKFAFLHPGVLHFTHEQAPRYELDMQRDKALEDDVEFQRELATSFGRMKVMDEIQDN
jgi:hypothetical protein